jgi:hypothetical protein
MLRVDIQNSKKACNILKYKGICHIVCLWLYSVANQEVRGTRNIRVKYLIVKLMSCGVKRFDPTPKPL